MSRECEGYIRHEEKQAVRETRTNNTPPSIIQDNKQLAHSTLTHSHVPLQSLCVCVGGGTGVFVSTLSVLVPCSLKDSFLWYDLSRSLPQSQRGCRSERILPPIVYRFSRIDPYRKSQRRWKQNLQPVGCSVRYPVTHSTFGRFFLPVYYRDGSKFGFFIYYRTRLLFRRLPETLTIQKTSACQSSVRWWCRSSAVYC